MCPTIFKLSIISISIRIPFKTFSFTSVFHPFSFVLPSVVVFHYSFTFSHFIFKFSDVDSILITFLDVIGLLSQLE
jgi:hypothetical protein